MNQPSDSSLLPAAQEFMDYLIFSKNKKTAYNYSRNVNAFLKFVNKPLKDITPMDITKWFNALRAEDHSDRTLARYGWALRSFFEVKGMTYLQLNTPIVQYNAAEPEWLDEPTTFKVIGRVPVLCVAYDLALRVGEVGLLKKRGFNNKTGDILVTRLKHKGQANTYTLKLDSWCLEILNRYLETHPKLDILFPFSVKLLQKTFTDHAQAIPLKGDCTFHSLRHSRITHIAIRQLEEKGVVDELSLAKFAGHLRVETTRMYVHLATKYMAFGRKGKI